MKRLPWINPDEERYDPIWNPVTGVLNYPWFPDAETVEWLTAEVWMYRYAQREDRRRRERSPSPEVDGSDGGSPPPEDGDSEAIGREQADDDTAIGHAKQADDDTAIGHEKQADDDTAIGREQADDDAAIGHDMQADDDTAIGHEKQADDDTAIGTMQADDDSAVEQTTTRPTTIDFAGAIDVDELITDDTGDNSEGHAGRPQAGGRGVASAATAKRPRWRRGLLDSDEKLQLLIDGAGAIDVDDV